MEKPYLKLKTLNKGAKILKKREEDAGYDIYAIFKDEIEFLEPGEIKIFRTGLSIEFPKNWVFLIAERGSTGTKGIAKRSGIIDSGYRGELFIPLNNTTNKIVVFYKDKKTLERFKNDIKEFLETMESSNKVEEMENESNDQNFITEKDVRLKFYIKDNYIFYPQSKAIAQGFLLYTPHVDVEIVNKLSDSERGDGRLGSSNK